MGDLTDVNEYHFVKALGRGAFAEVSLCTDGAGQHYAIKVFDKSLLRRKRQLIRRSSRSASAGGASPARRGLVISAHAALKRAARAETEAACEETRRLERAAMRVGMCVTP